MILEKILKSKRAQVAAAKSRVPERDLRARPLYAEARRGFIDRVILGGRAIIAEIKKASPSRGLIRADFNPVVHAHQYTPFVYSCLSRWWQKDAPVVFTEHGRLSDAAPSGKRRLANQILRRIPAATFAVGDLLASLARDNNHRGIDGVLAESAWDRAERAGVGKRNHLLLEEKRNEESRTVSGWHAGSSSIRT